MTIESNRSLGGIGACLMLIGIVSTIITLTEYAVGESMSVANLGVLAATGAIGMAAFVGFILFLIAMHGFSKDYKENKIFSYILWGFIITLILAIVIAVAWFALVMTNVLSAIITTLPNQATSPSTQQNQIQSLITPYLAPLTAALSFAMIVWAIYNFKAFNLLAEKSEVTHFKTAAKLFLLGAVVSVAVNLTVIILSLNGGIDYNTISIASLPGGLVQYIGWAFAAKGFFSIKPPPQTTPTFTQQAPIYTAPANPAVRYCMHCGAQNTSESAFCVKCGQKLY